MSELLCLKWNNHSPAFLKKLLWLRGKGQYCDATIVCQNKFFSVHKFVLSTCSEYFEEIFEMTQCKHPFIIVKDIQPSELEALLNYMYKGEINVLQELLPGLLKAAESLQIKGLTAPDDDVLSYESSDSSKSSEKISSNTTSPVLSNKIKNLNYGLPNKGSGFKEVTKDFNLESSKEICEDLCTLDLKNLNDKITFTKNIEEADFKKNISKSSRMDLQIEGFQLPTKGTPELEEPTQTILLKIITAVDTSLKPKYRLPEQSPQTKEEPIEILEQTNGISIKEDYINCLDKEQSHTVKDYKEDKVSNPMEDMQEDYPQCSTWEDVIPLSESGQLDHDVMQVEVSGRNISTICEMNMFETNEEISSMVSNVPGSKTEQEKEKTIQKKPGVKCPLCSHIATKPCKLKLHMYKHSGEKPFSCPHCTYTARTRYHVTVHLRKHTGEKPFECDYCSYKASNKANISRHMRIHSNEKPYQCPQCPYAATQASHLQDHMRQHYD